MAAGDVRDCQKLQIALWISQVITGELREKWLSFTDDWRDLLGEYLGPLGEQNLASPAVPREACQQHCVSPR